MTIDEAIEVLELHNQWRKGADIPMETPVRIGMAIDLVVCELKNLRIAHVSNSVCKCPLCGEEMKGIELTHYKCKKCNEYFTN